VAAREVALIIALRSNDPAVGYNRWPKGKAQPDAVTFGGPRKVGDRF
jgi:hypothetical protein